MVSFKEAEPKYVLKGRWVLSVANEEEGIKSVRVL